MIERKNDDKANVAKKTVKIVEQKEDVEVKSIKDEDLIIANRKKMMERMSKKKGDKQ
jgi:hypothetical protein